ncbi:MAG: aminoacyl-histidine dipeptidase [Lachnospiraceae bacterium]|nr:aminoacyl-histidine dipeptidase [Lachnospiraceae bacterium]
MDIKSLKPARVFEYFEYLSSVPHGSGNTKAISDLCVKFAKEHGLKYIQDDMNNVIIFKEASKGYENSTPVILQGHLDMVCAKEDDYDIDMAVTPIKLMCDGEFLYADRTSLGGDNIIAVASILSILDDDSVKAPAIEAVFTVDEETGMFGAAALDTSVLKGKTLINLDSEEEGVFTVGCAGGARYNADFPVNREDAFSSKYFEIVIDGLLGGHSGCDIDKERGMSHRLMARLLFDASKHVNLRLVKLFGGKFDNVIPLKTTAVVAIKRKDVDLFLNIVKEYEEIFKNEFKTSDPDIRTTVKEIDCNEKAVNSGDTVKILKLLNILPYGIQNMSMDIKGLVETSLNMGVLDLKDDSLHFSYSVRSSVGSRKEELISRLNTIVELFGGRYEVSGKYPAWEYAKESKIRDLCCKSYKDITGKDAVISATHGGLECGLLIDKIPGLDAVSFGPDLRDVHSVREKLGIKSTERMYELVLKILENCK